MRRRILLAWSIDGSLLRSRYQMCDFTEEIRESPVVHDCATDCAVLVMLRHCPCLCGEVRDGRDVDVEFVNEDSFRDRGGGAYGKMLATVEVD